MADNGTTKANNDQNVYILGAGFSADAGLPLIGGFMNKMRDAVDWLEKQGDRKREIEAITNVLAFRRRAASAAPRKSGPGEYRRIVQPRVGQRDEDDIGRYLGYRRYSGFC
jgi:hypothetical protein